ncbi:MAG: DUF928 domain-containing protein [Cyanobacteria bacterium J055]|nr:MAG: DUF928 domain-containing protein [Cyanobacteria bacterium J055]
MKFKFSVWVGSIALFASIYAPAVRAQTVTFEPRDQGSVEDSRSGTSRSAVAKCQSDTPVEPGLTPVVPTSHLGLTLSAHPTFYIYIPPTSAPYAQFTLKDEGDRTADSRGIYQTTIPLDGTAGIVAVPLPDSVSLEVGKTYSWFVGLVCQPAQTDFPWVRGNVQRIADEAVAETDLDRKTLLERAAIYGSAGLWYDTLHSPAQQVQTQPDDPIVRQNWLDLLHSVELQDLSDSPLIGDR